MIEIVIQLYSAFVVGRLLISQVMHVCLHLDSSVGVLRWNPGISATVVVEHLLLVEAVVATIYLANNSYQ